MDQHQQPVGLRYASSDIAILVIGMVRIVDGSRPNVLKDARGLVEANAMFLAIPLVLVR
jgi:hypothetical protein